MLSRKAPRDFIHVDEFWEADKYWDHYFIGNSVWIYADEYRAELPGDEDYSRIVVHGGKDGGWIYSRPLIQWQKVQKTLQAIQQPVSEMQLAELGFETWQSSYL